MSGRIQPNRVGYVGFTCVDSIEPYVLSCMCCSQEGSGCSEEYFNIPTTGPESTIGAEWDSIASSYISESDNNSIWLVDMNSTDNSECSDNMPSTYNYLTTGYIDSPPMRTRGMSVRVSSAGSIKASHTCAACYEIEIEDSSLSIPYGIKRVYYRDSMGDDVDIDFDSDIGTYPSQTIKADDVDFNHYDCSEDTTDVAFTYCPWLDGEKDLECDNLQLLSFDAESGIMSLDISSIPGYNGVGLLGLMIENGCLLFKDTEECDPT